MSDEELEEISIAMKALRLSSTIKLQRSRRDVERYGE